MIVHVFNHSTPEAEASISLWVQSQPSLQSKFQTSQGYTEGKKESVLGINLYHDRSGWSSQTDRELSTSQLLPQALVHGCQNSSLCLLIEDAAQDTQGHSRMLLEDGSRMPGRTSFTTIVTHRVDVVIRD